MPLFLILLFGGALFAIHRVTSAPAPVPARDEEEAKSAAIDAVSALRDAGGGALDMLRSVVSSGMDVPDQLVSDALADAYDKGDLETGLSIATLILPPEHTVDPVAGACEPESSPPTPPPTPSPLPPSPLPGISNEEWGDFLRSMETESPDYSSDVAAGCFRQRRDTCAAIPADREGQAAAFSAYMATAYQDQAPLINEHSTSEIPIGSEKIIATPSGILAVIKSAGPKNARKWFTATSEKRAKYPETIKAFQRANGIF